MCHRVFARVLWSIVLLLGSAVPRSVAQTEMFRSSPAATEGLRRLPPVSEPAGAGAGPNFAAPAVAPPGPATQSTPLLAPPEHGAEAPLPTPEKGPTPPKTPSASSDEGPAEETVEPAADASADSPGEPTDVDPKPTYSWHSIHFWFPPDLWEASIELGVNGSEGNSNTLNTQVGANAKRTTDVQILELDLTYTNNTSNSVETANQGLFTSRYDWLVPESAASLFINSSLEFDRFRAFDLRWALNLGLGFSVIRNERTTLAGRFGSGVSQEVGGPDEQYVPEATFGLEFSHQLNKQQKVAIKVDYFPDWQNYGSFRVNTDAGWEILLSEPMNLSLKLAILDRYDSTPNGAELNDLNYSLLLLWKL